MNAKTVFWAMNRARNTVERLPREVWPHCMMVKGAARMGILMADGHSADAIGHSKSERDFIRRAKHGGTRIL